MLLLIVITWHQTVSTLAPNILTEIESWFHPLNTEVESECDGVVLVIDAQHIRDLKT